MVDFPDKYTPWWKCSPLGTPYYRAYFLGLYACPVKGLCDLWVRVDWRGYALMSATGSWKIGDPFTLTKEDACYPKFEFMNRFVLHDWWFIVNSAPVFG